MAGNGCGFVVVRSLALGGGFLWKWRWGKEGLAYGAEWRAVKAMGWCRSR